MTDHAQPLPIGSRVATLGTEQFWQALESGRLVLPHCRCCDWLVWYPRFFCPRCSSTDLDSRELSGLGMVYTATVVRKSYGEFADLVPYVVAYVELVEGPRVLTNIVNVDPDAVTIGMPVRLVVQRSEQGSVAYRFEPVSGQVPGGTS